MASAQPETIYKGWLKKATEPDGGSKKKTFLRSSGSWKKRYVVLLRDHSDGHDGAMLAIFDKEVASNFEKPKASLKLSPWYRVDKKHDPTGKQHIFEVRTPRAVWRFMADSQTVMDLWVFYLQTQTQLRTDFPGRCFEVSPDDSESMRRIGARASTCLLHLSKWGLTLALKRTRSLVAQWPLKSMREFESSETGRFSFKAGRSAPMGEGDYVFATPVGQDGEIYDLLDAYTNEDLGTQGDAPQTPASSEQVNQDYERLRLATFGLLPRRGSSGRPISPNHTQHSPAVPVPGRGGKSYDRLDRSRDGSNHKIDRSKSEQVKKTQEAPAVPPRVPSLPSKTPLPPSVASTLNQDYNLPYAEMGGASVGVGDGDEGSLPYADMGAGSGSDTLTRRAVGRDSKDRMSWEPPQVRGFLRGSVAASDRSSYQFMEYTPKSYRNTLTENYENTPLISPSPKGFRGVSNDGFANSPAGAQSVLSTLTLQDNYNMVDSPPRPAPGSGPPSPLIHTYFDGSFPGGSGGNSSGEREHHYQGVDYESTAGSGSLARSTSMDNLRSPSITDSYIDRSPTLGSLDLAFGFPAAQMPDWMNSRQLPSLPRTQGPPTEENPYVISPKKHRYAYEEVNNVFPPTPAQDSRPTSPETDYEAVNERPPQEINIQGHVLLSSTFPEGYIDSKTLTSYEDVDDVRQTTARIVTQEPPNVGHTAVVAPGVMYSQVVVSKSDPDLEMQAEEEPKPEKRRSFKARTLERVKMFKSKSLVDLSAVSTSEGRRSLALEDLPSKRTSASMEFKKGMKKSASNPNLLSEQTPEPTQRYSSPNKTVERQAASPVSGVRRKFGLGLKMMRQKSRSRDDDGESGDSASPSKAKSPPKLVPRKTDVKGISTTPNTKSYTRRSQGQLSDLPSQGGGGGGENKGKGGKPQVVTHRQRAVSAGSAVTIQAMLNEQSHSTGMINNPLAFGAQSPPSRSSSALGSPSSEVDEEGYLTPSEVGSPVKRVFSPEPDMSDRPLPERPLPSPPNHSQSAPLMSLKGAKVTQEWQL